MGGIQDIIDSGQFPGVVVKGERQGNIHAVKPGPNHNFETHDAATQEKIDKKVVAYKRQLAAEARKARRGTKRQDGEIRRIGSLPLSLRTAREQEHGKGYWSEDPKEALKREGLYFPE